MSQKVLTEQPSLLPRDPVLSFVDRAYDQSDVTVKKTVAENLQRMVEKFATCRGEFFLVVKLEKDSFRRDFVGGDGLLPPHDFSYIRTDLYLSIISGELQFGGEPGISFHFPIQPRYVTGDLIGKPFLHESEKGVWNILLGYEVMMWLKESRGKPDLDKPGLDIAVGYEEVRALIRNHRNAMHEHHGEFPLIAPVCRMGLLLGRLIPNFPEQEELFKKDKKLFDEVWAVMGK